MLNIYRVERGPVSREGELIQAVVVAASVEDARWLVVSNKGTENASVWRTAGVDLVGVAAEEFTGELVLSAETMPDHSNCEY